MINNNIQYIMYTVILDQYDRLPTFRTKDNQIRHICLTNCVNFLKDDPMISDWEIVEVPNIFIDRKLTNGFYKSRSDIVFSGNTISIWVDANLKELNISKDFIEEITCNNPVVTLPHLIRSTVFDESSEVVLSNLEFSTIAHRNLEYMKLHGFQDDQGLAATMLIIRDQTDQRVIDGNQNWWNIISNGVRRDQLSFNYSFWKAGIGLKYLPIDWREPNILFSRSNHYSSSSRGVHGCNIKSIFNAPELDFPNLPESYPKGVSIVKENFGKDELNILSRINKIVNEYSQDGHLEGNYCHFDGSKVCEYTPPDLRRSWKREYLRKSIKGSRRALEIGFNAGHSASIILTNESECNLLSLDINRHLYTEPAAREIKKQFPNRFNLIVGDSKEILPTINRSEFDFVHIDGGHGYDDFMYDFSWFLENTNKSCRLLVDDSYVSYISNELNIAVMKSLIRKSDDIVSSSGENQLYIKTS